MHKKNCIGDSLNSSFIVGSSSFIIGFFSVLHGLATSSYNQYSSLSLTSYNSNNNII